MQLVDHLFVFLLFVVQPIHGAFAYRRYLGKIKAGEPANTVRLYRETLLGEWIAFAVLVGTWIYLDRGFAALGFVAPGGRDFWIGVALLTAMCLFLGYSWRSATAMSADEKDRQRQSFGDLVHFLPQTRREYRTFFGLSITAGIVEETVYRGFVFWYLAQVMPMWAVVLVSSVVFGLGHSYQGAGGVMRVALIGVAAGALYVYTGSIWLPIIGHALLDILQGGMLLEILRNHSSHSGNSSSSSGSTIVTTPDGSGVSGGSGKPSSGSEYSSSPSPLP